jgi:hypothetical protein
MAFLVMKTYRLPAVGLACILAMPWACAQQGSDSRASYARAGADVPLLHLNPPREYASVVHQWIADLEKAGVVNRSLPGPYRIALPLITFGDDGAALKLTYTRNLPGSSGSGGPLLFLHIPMP